MPLTYHFYRLDEVYAAIIYTGSRGIAKETVFWCRELIISGHASEAISALFESWLWHRGPFHLSWLTEAMKRLGGSEISEEDILWMAQQLSTCSVKDNSLWNLIAISATDPESLFDRVTPRSPVMFPSNVPMEQFFLRAIYQHRAGAAWWAGRHLSLERWWWLLEWYRNHIGIPNEAIEMIKGYERLLGYRSEIYDYAIRGLALLTLCLTSEQRQKSMSALPVLQGIGSEWDSVLGRRAGRIYPIPYHGLYGTLRGRMRQTESTVDDLFDIEKAVRGCAIWDERLTRDSYELYFPDDIPDEWTATEKEKSHGSGLLQRTEHVSLWGYMKRYTGRCRMLWNKKPQSDMLDKVELDDSPFLTLLSLLALDVKDLEVEESRLRPVHKRKVVD